jgi:uncharacterized UBP type Zn finger protein
MIGKECIHFDQIKVVEPSTTKGCTNCLKKGDTWVHLRICKNCGYVGCCDNSKNKHATAHYNSTKHPIIQSREPEEYWMWCYICNLGWNIEYFELE